MNGLTPNKFVDSSITALTSLGVGIFGFNNASRLTDIPTEFGTHAVLIYRFIAAYPNKATMIVDMEGTVGIYMRYSDTATFHKQ